MESKFMKNNGTKTAGLLLFVGGVQSVLGIMIAEALYPSYSISQNYVSDLSIGPSVLIFNSSVFLLGVLGLVSVYFLRSVFKSRIFSAFLALTFIGAIGDGLCTENQLILHLSFAVIAFAFGGISAIMSYKFEESPLSYGSMVLGVVTLLALALFSSGVTLGLGLGGINLGLGPGGIERIVVYPILLWIIGLGAYLIGSSSQRN